MNPLKTLEGRIKGAKLYLLKRANKERLYIPYYSRRKDTRISAWFEVINDKLEVRVKVKNTRKQGYFNDVLAKRYKNEIEKQFHELIMNCELTRKSVPLNDRLKDSVIPVNENSLTHQANALRFCCSMKVSALFADTGTGKTKIAIDLCTSRWESQQINKVIVFSPVSLKNNFRAEINKWAPNLPVRWKIIGIESISKSMNILNEALDFIDSETQIIIDESHLVKNPLAKRSKRIRMCCQRTSYKLIMTGTPVTENVHNLYMQYAMLSNLIIGVNNWLKFEERYAIMGGFNGDEIIGYKNIDHLMSLLEPYTYQVAKEDCLSLPAVVTKRYKCALTQLQATYYSSEKRRLLSLIDNYEIGASEIFKVFVRMQQISSGYFTAGKNREIIELGTNKFSLLEKVDLSMQTVFFCKFLYEAKLIVEHLGRDKCSIFTGKNPQTRDIELQNFVARKNRYFVATMQSGGTGLNGLQEVCCQVVFFSNSFSYYQRKQSIGRIDRQGQVKQMTVIDLLTDSGIDLRIMAAINRKSNLAEEIRVLLKDKTKLKEYVENL